MLLEAEIYKMLVNGDEWGQWRGYQLPVSDQYVTIWTPRGTRRHWKPRKWKPDFFISENHSLSYFWPGAWYTIHVAYREDGTFSDAYCDIVLPTPPYTSASRKLIYTPQRLPRTDWETLTTQEIHTAMRFALNGQGENDTRRTI